MTESPSTGSGGQSSVLCPDGLPVYIEILCLHNTKKYNLHVYRSIYSNKIDSEFSSRYAGHCSFSGDGWGGE